MRVLVTGALGQLGSDCIKELATRGHDVIGTTSGMRADCNISYDILCDKKAFDDEHYQKEPYRSKISYEHLDITDQYEVKKLLDSIRPDAVIHCAAWTDVDGAEDENNFENVWNVNAKGTEYLARAAENISSKMIYISTDYVFDGKGSSPHRPDDRDFAPLNVYGRSKLAGETAVSSLVSRFFIVRTAWVFGLKGKNFVNTMIKAAKKYDHVRVVCDQIGTPTYTVDLARLIADMATTEKYGFYHAANCGISGCKYISWYEFCCEIYKKCGLNTKVIPVTTEEYGLSRAERPKNSRLETDKLKKSGFEPLPDWKDALERYLKEMNRYGADNC